MVDHPLKALLVIFLVLWIFGFVLVFVYFPEKLTNSNHSNIITQYSVYADNVLKAIKPLPLLPQLSSISLSSSRYSMIESDLSSIVITTVPSARQSLTPQPISSQYLRSNDINQQTVQLKTTLLSRGTNVSVSSDIRGNLGPCSVVVQNPPGNDWIKDRWQAASDMGGTAVPGHHYLMLDFQRLVTAQRVVIDWETAYADAYRIQARTDQPPLDASGRAFPNTGWITLFDGTLSDSTSLKGGLRGGTSLPNLIPAMDTSISNKATEQMLQQQYRIMYKSFTAIQTLEKYTKVIIC